MKKKTNNLKKVLSKVGVILMIVVMIASFIVQLVYGL